MRPLSPPPLLPSPLPPCLTFFSLRLPSAPGSTSILLLDSCSSASAAQLPICSKQANQHMVSVPANGVSAPNVLVCEFVERRADTPAHAMPASPKLHHSLCNNTQFTRGQEFSHVSHFLTPLHTPTPRQGSPRSCLTWRRGLSGGASTRTWRPPGL